MPPEHMAQVQGNIWIHKSDWWDFVSYDPRMPPSKRLYVQRIDRDKDYIERLSIDVLTFAEELDEALSEIFGNF